MDFCTKLQLHRTFTLILLSVAKTICMISAGSSYSFEVVHPHALRQEEPNMASSLHSISSPVVHGGTQQAHLAVLSIGTPPTRYHLDIDTGSYLTWIQCINSREQFNQTDPLFDPTASSTYAIVDPSDPLCAPPSFHHVQAKCMYDHSYEDGSRVEGVLSREQFMAQAANGTAVTIGSMPFGCNYFCTGDGFLSNSAGLLGLGMSAVSLPNHISRKFSYCLPGSPERQGYLRFGTEENGGPSRQQPLASTPLLMYNGSSDYFLKLLDITIAGQRLQLANGTFDYDVEYKEGGFIIDTGASRTVLITSAYQKVEEVVEDYFETRDFMRTKINNMLCYWKQEMADGYPNMVFHFQGADYVIAGGKLFMSYGERFCLFVEPKEDISWLGNYHQQDVRFVYDIDGRRLGFRHEICGG